MIHLRKEFSEHGIDSELVAAKSASEYLNAKEINFVNYNDNFLHLLSHRYYDAILTGTSENPDSIAFQLISEARENNIPSFSFVDSVANTEYRFKGRTEHPLAFSPDVIFVTEETCKSSFIELGFEKSRIIVSGHPLYHYLQTNSRDKEFRTIQSSHFDAAKSSGKFVITFACETLGGFASGLYHRRPNWTIQGRGKATWMIKIALEALIDSLLRTKLRDDVFLNLRLHPKNTEDDFFEYIHEVDNIEKNTSSIATIHSSDLVCGVETSFIIEAALHGCPTISIQPADFITTNLNQTSKALIRQVRSINELERDLTETLVKNDARFSNPLADIEVPVNSTNPTTIMAKEILNYLTDTHSTKTLQRQ